MNRTMLLLPILLVVTLNPAVAVAQGGATSGAGLKAAAGADLPLPQAAPVTMATAGVGQLVFGPADFPVPPPPRISDAVLEAALQLSTGALRV
jgi:hypothetical protein